MTQERAGPDRNLLVRGCASQTANCGKFRRRQGEPRIRWNPVKWLTLDLFFGTMRMAVSNDSANSWPGVVKAPFLREVGLMFPWVGFGEKIETSFGEKGWRQERLSRAGEVHGRPGPPVMLPKGPFEMERTEASSLQHTSY